MIGFVWVADSLGVQNTPRARHLSSLGAVRLCSVEIAAGLVGGYAEFSPLSGPFVMVCPVVDGEEHGG